MRILNTPLHLLALALGSLALAPPAGATLGAGLGSVEADRAALNGQLTVSSAGGYGVREITTPAGVHIREYLTAAGTVFALSWQGPVRPDLRQMLGGYYARYAQAAAAPHVGGHRHLAVEQPGLVVESNGRMRAFYGRAWDPTLLPAHFPVADLR
jgi:Protein of unknown function (DUF2844)